MTLIWTWVPPARSASMPTSAPPTPTSGRSATLSVGRAGQRHRDPCAGDGLSDLNGVADRPDVGVGGALVGIDADRAGGTQVQISVMRQRARGPHPDVDDDEVGGEGGTVGQAD